MQTDCCFMPIRSSEGKKFTASTTGSQIAELDAQPLRVRRRHGMGRPHDQLLLASKPL